MKISAARAAAFDVLLRVETEKAFTSNLLPQFEEALSTADSALCHELTLGSLRKQIYLDRIIAILAGGKKLDTAVRVAIRLGLYQLLFLDRIPDYSAINESVMLAQRAKKTSAKGFVNAVLRRATRDKIELEFEDDIDRIVAETSHPRWLLEKWIADSDIYQAELMARANNEIPQTTLRPLKEIDPQQRSEWQKSDFVDNCYVAERLDPQLRELEKSGVIYFQDEASQMIAQSINVANCGAFFDVCAAPGGKTGMIAQGNRDKLKLAVAGDLHWPRVEYLRDNLIRQGAESVNIVQYDAVNGLPFDDASFDTVLVDAPCSGTGTIRHNPEIRYYLKPEDFKELATKQLAILTNASKTVKHGGSLVYSTCSLELEENEVVSNRFLSENPEFTIGETNLQQRFTTSEGFARTWPQRDNMDGFFLARFVRQN